LSAKEPRKNPPPTPTAQLVLKIGKLGRLKKQQRILKDPKVLKWFTTLRLSSPNTAENYLRRLDYLCYTLIDPKPFHLDKDEQLTPRQIIRKYRSAKKAKHFLQDLVTELSGKKSRDNINNYVKVLKSWFAENDIEHIGKITLPTKKSHLGRRTVGRAASPEQLGEILARATVRQRVPISLMAFSGFRPEVLGNSEGTDGLKVADFWEMQIEYEKDEKQQDIVESGKVKFGVYVKGKDEKMEWVPKIPTLIVVRIESSKTRTEYVTFLNEEGCLAVKDYLEQRMQGGEKLTPKSPILVPRNREPDHITTHAVERTIRTAIKNVKLESRPYELRSYFETRMEQAENDGVILKDWRKHWAGHVGDIDARYTHDKGASNIPDYLMEDMRQTYKEAESYLTTKQPKLIPADKIRAEVVRVFFKGAKLKDKAVAEIEEKYGGLEKVPDDDLPKIVDEYQRKGYGTYASAGKQIIASPTDARKYLGEGYTYVATLPTNEIVLQTPS
jgi:integrase